jgi:dTDP-4-dehydrorhamnose reductase
MASPARKALVIGASGLVGSHVLAELRKTWDVTGTYHRPAQPGLLPLDMTDAAATLELVRAQAPAVVLCPAAEPSVDRCEQDPQGSRRINIAGTRAVCDAARAVGATMVYFSTDYVFDGSAPPYAEDAPCAPMNEYGRQKVACEEIVRAYPKHLIARVSAVYGWEAARKNYVVRLIQRVRGGERPKAWTDQVLTPTWAPNLAEVMRRLAESGATGTFHVCGGRPIDRYLFSRLVCSTFGLDPEAILPVTSDEFQPTPTPRPRDVGLRADRVRQLPGVALVPPEVGLVRMREAGDPFAPPSRCASSS